jgi:hypothetical protein
MIVPSPMLEFFHKDGTRAMIPICAWFVGGFGESIHKIMRCEIVYSEEYGHESKEEDDESMEKDECIGDEERSVEDDEENADDKDFISDGEEGKDDVSVVTNSTGLPDIDKLYLTL